MKRISCALLCLFLLLFLLPSASATEEAYEMVTSADQLSPGDRIIIAAAWYDCAMSAQQRSNNRGSAPVTKNGDTLIPSADVQIITLEEGTMEGTWAFRTDTGYLCASSSSSNHLKTQAEPDDNCSWLITFSNGEATVTAQGENTRNVMQYHANSAIFSCYMTATQTAIAIYKSPSAPQPEVCEHAETELIPSTASTHSILCSNSSCDSPLLDTVPCAFSVADRGDGYHVGICPCGNISPAEAHTYSAQDYLCFCGAVGYPGDTLTVSQANAMMALLGSDVTQEMYHLTGAIVTSDGNLILTDTDGNKLQVSGPESVSAYQTGDTVTVRGHLDCHGMVNAQITAHTPYVCTHSGYEDDYLCDGCGILIPPPADSALTVLQALALGGAYPESVSPSNYTEGRYFVTGQVTEVTDTTYGNLHLADENGNILTVYGVYDASGNRYDDMTDPPRPGDTVTVYGVIGKYNSTVQMKSAQVSVHKTHTCDYAPATCLTPSTCKDCGAVKGGPLGHDLAYVPAADPTADTEGCLEHWSCSRCGRLFSDDQGTRETTWEDVTLDKLPLQATEPSADTTPSAPTENVPPTTGRNPTAPSTDLPPVPTEPSSHDPNTDRTMILVCALFLTAMVTALLIIVFRKDHT